MTVKEYLGQSYRIDQRINSKLEQVGSLRALATKATSTMSDTPPSGSRNVQSMESIIVKIIDLENEINEDIDMLVDLKREIVGVIKRIENTESQTLLELLYLGFGAMLGLHPCRRRSITIILYEKAQISKTDLCLLVNAI